MSNNILNISKKIISRLPYLDDFLFVNSISFVDEQKIIGHYTFKKDTFYYKAHFAHKPETPGVLLIETLGQIGMVCHLIYLNKLYDNNKLFRPVLSNVETSFLKQIQVNEELTVVAEKEYLRNNVLRSNLKMLNSKNEVCVLCKAQLQLIYD